MSTGAAGGPDHATATQLIVARSLGRIEGKLDGILTEQRRAGDHLIDTAGRVGALEQGRSRQEGKAAVYGGLGGVVAALLALLLNWLS